MLEPEPVKNLKSASSRLLLCDLGVLWWQSCDNSSKLYFLKFKFEYQLFYLEPEPEPVQVWTGSTTLAAGEVKK